MYKVKKKKKKKKNLSITSGKSDQRSCYRQPSWLVKLCEWPGDLLMAEIYGKSTPECSSRRRAGIIL